MAKFSHGKEITVCFSSVGKETGAIMEQYPHRECDMSLYLNLTLLVIVLFILCVSDPCSSADLMLEVEYCKFNAGFNFL